MFDNVLYQNTSTLLSNDIKNDRLPGSILFAGPTGSGKLTCALELARVLSCSAGQNGFQPGDWKCSCSSCRLNKVLACPSVLVAGHRDCSLEIRAAYACLLRAVENNASYITAVRYLFIRAVRKLTMRFSQILWEDDDKLSKIASFVQIIEEQLELLDPEKALPEDAALKKIGDEIVKQAEKLENGFMYDSLPISQIRRISTWAHIKSSSSKKVVIIENVDLMLEGVRNSLLKILEEPPSDTSFILTTTRKGAVMPTILSRVRTYPFSMRTRKQQEEVIQRVFHDTVKSPIKGDDYIVNGYLEQFLPVTPEVVNEWASYFYEQISSGHIPEIEKVIKNCASFDPRILLKMFLNDILSNQSIKNNLSSLSIEAESRTVDAVRACSVNVTVYNQTPIAALEKLVRDMASIRRNYGVC